MIFSMIYMIRSYHKNKYLPEFITTLESYKPFFAYKQFKLILRDKDINKHFKCKNFKSWDNTFSKFLLIIRKNNKNK